LFVGDYRVNLNKVQVDPHHIVFIGPVVGAVSLQVKPGLFWIGLSGPGPQPAATG
jgi:hypothetical protein